MFLKGPGTVHICQSARPFLNHSTYHKQHKPVLQNQQNRHNLAKQHTNPDPWFERVDLSTCLDHTNASFGSLGDVQTHRPFGRTCLIVQSSNPHPDEPAGGHRWQSKRLFVGEVYFCGLT